MIRLRKTIQTILNKRNPILKSSNRYSLPQPLSRIYRSKPSAHIFSLSIKQYSASGQLPGPQRVMSLLREGEKSLRILKYSECRRKYEEALEISLNELGLDSYESGLTLNCLGQLSHMEGDLLAAVDFYGQALDILGRDLKQNRAILASIHNNMSLGYQNIADTQKAIECLQSAVDLLSTDNPAEAEQKVDLFWRIGALHKHDGNLVVAKTSILEACNLLKSLKRKENPMLGRAFLRLGEIAVEEGNIEEAFEFKEKAVSEIEASGETSILLRPIYEELVNHYKASGNEAKELVYLEKLANILKKTHKPDTIIKAINILRQLSDKYTLKGQHGEATKRLVEAIQTYRGFSDELQNVEEILLLYRITGKPYWMLETTKKL